ncbi:hypothetical protein ACHQM5_021389 [Ranunculus cassubicifolius]
MKFKGTMAIFVIFLLMNTVPQSQAIDLLSMYNSVSVQRELIKVFVNTIGSTLSSIFLKHNSTDLVDWKETPHTHYILIDAPGLKNEDIKIVVDENGVLKVSGERNKETPNKGHIWHRRERYWRFSHEFQFSNNVDLDSVGAKLEDGVLTLFLAKLSPDKIRAPRVVKIVKPEDL